MNLTLVFKITSWIVIIVSFIVNKINCESSQYSCALDGKQCNTYRRRACCYSNSICELVDGFFICNKKSKIEAYLGEACHQSSDCYQSTFVECSGNICTCATNTIAVNRTSCLPLPESLCELNKDCKANNTICIDYQCRCTSNHVNSGSKCIPKYLNESCQENSDCTEIRFAICSAGICACRSDHIAIKNNKCAPILSGYCSENRKCMAHNSKCIDSSCQCRDNHLVNANKQCIPITLGGSCKPNIVYRITNNNYKCSKDEIFICNDNFVASKNDLCVPISNGFCLNDKQCKFYGFHCVDNKCQCKPSFTMISKHQCVEKDHVPSCTQTIECSDSWHAQCYNNKCVCTPNHIAINNATCYPILGGLCWNDHQCLTTNSECFDFHCQCKSGYVMLSDNLCSHILPSDVQL